MTFAMLYQNDGRYGHMDNKINVRGVYFDNVNMSEALEKAKELIAKEGLDSIYTPNSEIVQNCVENHENYEVINSASLIIPDGIGVVYGAKILGTPLKEKVPGCELAEKVVEYISTTGDGLYLFGAAPANSGEGRESIADLAAKKLCEKYPGLVISGTSDGYFKPDDVPQIIEDINNSGAKVLFVCLGAPKQEKWIYEHRNELKVSLAMGLGGSLDVFSGTVKRAPEFFIKHNLEWFYRLLKMPTRIGRMMKLPKFILGVIFKRNRI